MLKAVHDSKTIQNIYGEFISILPHHIAQKYLITSVVVTIPTKSSPSHTGKA
jgi:hypothetical protein